MVIKAMRLDETPERVLMKDEGSRSTNLDKDERIGK